MRVLSKTIFMMCLALFASFALVQAQAPVEAPTNDHDLKLQQMQQAVPGDGNITTEEQQWQWEQSQIRDERLEEEQNVAQDELIAEMKDAGYWPIPGFSYTGNPDVDLPNWNSAMETLKENNLLLYQDALQNQR